MQQRWHNTATVNSDASRIRSPLLATLLGVYGMGFLLAFGVFMTGLLSTPVYAEDANTATSTEAHASSTVATVSVSITSSTSFSSTSTPSSDDTAEPKGSITVCKMITNGDGSIATDSSDLPNGSFSIDLSHSAHLGNDVFETVTFETDTFDVNTAIFGNADNAECVTIDDLALEGEDPDDPSAGYFYDTEDVTGSAWITPRYNDQFDVSVDGTDDFFRYSPELFEDYQREMREDARNKNADGHITLTEGRPHRTLVVKNTYETHAATPTAALIADPTEVTQGGTTTLKWTSEHTQTCVGTNFETNGATSGTTTVGNIQNTTDFILNCENAEGDIASSTATVTVATTSPDATTISATKVVCDEEGEFPNWHGEDVTITQNTAAEFVARTNGHCWLASGWEFQWGYADVDEHKRSGDYVGEAPTGDARNLWKTFPEATNENGIATATVTDLKDTSRLWVREVLKEGYIGFSDWPLPSASSTEEEPSARVWCHDDVVNRDNHDFIEGPKAGETYHCIAFNTATTAATATIPTVSLTADPREVDKGATTTITWDSQDAISCDSPDFETEGATTGTTTIGNITQDLTASVTCESDTGHTATASTTVTVKDDGNGGGGTTETGSITICKMIAASSTTATSSDEVATTTMSTLTLATSSTDLPSGTFSIDVADSLNIATNTLETATFTAQSFAPNTAIFGEGEVNNAQCVTIEDLPLSESTTTTETNGYFYGEEVVTGDSAWLAPQYNDQSTTQATSTGNFFAYSPELFEDYDGEQATSTRNVDADGHIILTEERPDRTLLLLNIYEGAPTTTITADPIEVPQGGTTTVEWTSDHVETCEGTNFNTGGATSGTTTVSGIQAITTFSVVCENTGGDTASSSVTVTVSDDDDDDDGDDNGDDNGGGGSGGGGGTTTTTSGGGGGGGFTPLDIENEELRGISGGTSVIVEWDTNKRASSQVVYGTTSIPFSRLDEATSTYGYHSQTIEFTDNKRDHLVGVDGLTPGETYFFRPVSRTNNEEATGKELSYTYGASGTGGPVQDGSCSPLIEDYMRIDWDNDPEEVTKLQVFLSEYENIDVPITGEFGQQTYNGVVTFQERYFDDVLAPWGHDAGTGFVYITTSTKINEIVCQRDYPFTEAELEEMEEFRAFLAALRSGDGSQEGSGQTGDNNEGGQGTTIATTSDETATTSDEQETVAEEEEEELFAGAFLSFPTAFEDIVWCIAIFVLTLLALYLVTTLFIPYDPEASSEERRRVFMKRSGLFAGLTLIALIIAVLLPIACIVVPLGIVIIATLIAMAVRYQKKEDTSQQDGNFDVL